MAMTSDRHRSRMPLQCGGNIWFEDHHANSDRRESSFVDVHIAISEPHSSVSIGEDCMFAYDIDLAPVIPFDHDSSTGARINPQEYMIGNQLGRHLHHPERRFDRRSFRCWNGIGCDETFARAASDSRGQSRARRQTGH